MVTETGSQRAITRTLMTVAALALLSAPANGKGELESMNLAMALGGVLASENVCGLAYKHDAIRKFIDTKVPADDLKFAGIFGNGGSGRAYTIKEVSESTKVAHCRQIERVAKSYGFI
jgi:hypothetical protein